MSTYSITPLTKLLRENNIPTSPLRKSTGKSTGNYGNVIWVQTRDGYSYSKSRNDDYVWFYVQGDEVIRKMKDVIESNGYEVDYYQENGFNGGEMSVDLKQFTK